MVITTGMISPSWSLAEVLALNALQNSMMLTPCGPSAVPTGGAGVALPAGICSLTEPVIFFAMTKPLQTFPRAHAWGYNTVATIADPAIATNRPRHRDQSATHAVATNRQP